MEKNIIDNNEIRGSMMLPNATAALVLGILSIVFCFCYGIIGLVLGIIGIVLANKSIRMYHGSPESYNMASLTNVKAGRVCAIIGTSLSGLYLLIILIALLVIGSTAALGPLFNGMK